MDLDYRTVTKVYDCLTRYLHVRVWISALVLGAILPIAVGATVARADDDLPEHRGLIEQMPADGRIGTWTVGGQTFTADTATEFDEVEGTLALGVCAKVEYQDMDGTLLAREIDSEPASDCDGSDDSSDNSGDDSVDDGNDGSDDGNDDGGDDLPKHRGLIEQMPADGRAGTWTVGGQTFSADTATEFDEIEGTLAPGVCAEVEYQDMDGTLLAREIDSEPASDCDGSDDSSDNSGDDGNDDGVDDGNDSSDDSRDDGDDELEQYGLIEQMPVGARQGSWVIDGRSYSADSDTEFEEEHGAFQVGQCVNVESNAATPTIAEKIESERQYRCGGDDEQPPTAEIYGIVTQVPDGLTGLWIVGGIEFHADANTEFDQEDDPITVGATVKVKFYTDTDDVNWAVEIESKYTDDNDDHQRGSEGHAYGKIDSLPESQGLLGEWSIGGTPYIVDEATELDDEVGQYGVGNRVKVEYYTDSSNRRIADEIELTDDDGEVDDESHVKLLGFVESMPDAGFIGTWTIGGTDFTVDLGSRLTEEHGLFGIGAYVEVEYAIVGNERIVYELDTEVPPGAGDTTRIGPIERIDDSIRSAAVQAISADQWVVGGQVYVVVPATQLNDDGGDLSVGSIAIVNSYIGNDGRAVATSIRTVPNMYQVAFPLLIR